MRRLMVIRIDDDEEGVPEDLARHEVVGLFRMPTVFCDGCSTGKRVRGFTKGRRWGWWVCTVCKKPTHAWGTNIRAIVSDGRDLREDSE